MKFFEALAGLFFACLIGQIFMTVGIDGRVGAWPISPSVFYVFIVIFSFPFWLFTFVPLYVLVSPKALFWRWYIAPVVGAIIGFVSGLILFAPTQYEFEDFPRQYLAPLVIGLATFLFGTVMKKLSSVSLSA